MDYEDINSYIEEITGYKYNVVENEDLGNYTNHRVLVSKKLNDFDSKQWFRFKNTGKQESYMLQTILNGLCSENKIEAGEYLISVYW